MKIYLAATAEFYRYEIDNPTSHTHRLYIETGHTLISYNGSAKFNQMANNVIKRAAPQELCVDSGAHVWLSKYHKTGERPPVREVEIWLNDFLAMLEGFKPSCPLDFIVELDLQRMYGQDVVRAWRRDLWMPFEARTGTRVCYVWHTPDGAEGWESMLNDPGMGFLGMPVRGERDYAQRGKMVSRAYVQGKPVHGFAAVHNKWMRAVPFYSVDSTSWAASLYFGNVPTFDARRGAMRLVHLGRTSLQADKKQTLGKLISNTGGRISVQNAAGKHENRNISTLHQSAAHEYLQAEQWLTAYWRTRGVDWDARLAQLAAAR